MSLTPSLPVHSDIFSRMLILMWKAPRAALVASLIAAFAPHPAAAAQSPDGTQNPNGQRLLDTQRLYGDGVRLFEAGQYREAERFLRAAHLAAPTVGTAFYLGRSLVAMRRCSEALPLLEQVAGLLGDDARGLAAEGARRADLYACAKRRQTLRTIQHNNQRDSHELGVALMAIGFPLAGLGLAGMVAGLSSDEPPLILLGVFSGLYLMVPGTIIGIVGIVEYEPDPGPLRLPELPSLTGGGGRLTPGLGVQLTF